MKRFLGFVGVFGVLAFGLIFTGTASADLTKQDIEEIRRIVREEIQREIQSVNERIDGLDKRIDGLDKRIDDMMEIMLGGFGILFAGMFALVGFVLWDRRSALAPAVREMKTLEERENKIEKILREYAQKEPQLAAIMRSITL